MIGRHGIAFAVVMLHEAGGLLQLRDFAPLHPSQARSALLSRKHALCSQKSANKNPGAGIDPSTPFADVYKDGYMAVGCFKDELLYFGDKYGTHKHDYRMGEISNVSIVRYEVVVAKENRQAMSTDVCFDFCRTIPDMSSFGIAHGRDCYCAPFFKQLAGDDSMCDSVCEGNPTQMCGGHSKSSIFQMHSCSDGGQDMQNAASAATASKDLLVLESGKLAPLVESMQTIAAAYQERLGNAGDVAATGLMQQAKVVAGELNQSLVQGASVVDALAAKLTESGDATPGSADHAAVQAAETIEGDLDNLAKVGNDIADELTELRREVSPSISADELAPLFYKIMYFVDKKFEDAPTTCSGDLLDKPIVGKTYLECGRICDRRGQECKGFSYFPDGLCFLMKKFKTVRYYTKCDEAPQKMEDFNTTSCSVRFSDYQGTNISPTSKNCKECLKEVEGASGCRLG